VIAERLLEVDCALASGVAAPRKHAAAESNHERRAAPSSANACSALHEKRI
jgi:hypothetical protein